MSSSEESVQSVRKSTESRGRYQARCSSTCITGESSHDTVDCSKKKRHKKSSDSRRSRRKWHKKGNSKARTEESSDTELDLSSHRNNSNSTYRSHGKKRKRSGARKGKKSPREDGIDETVHKLRLLVAHYQILVSKGERRSEAK